MFCEGKPNIKCDLCVQGKMCRKKFSISKNNAENVLDKVHSDLFGKITPQSMSKSSYFVTFLDDASRYSEVAILKKKSEVLREFKKYVNHTEVLHETRVKVLQSDNGGEYISNAFDEYLAEKGIERGLSVPRTPQQNGRAGRLNRTLLNITRCLIFQSGLPKYFWGEALITANDIRNCCPSRAINN